MIRRRRRRLRPKQKEEMNLQITSMADIFMILLVFLLKSFSTGISTMTPSRELTLPIAKTSDQVSETLKLEILSDSILVDDNEVTSLKDFKNRPDDLEGDGTFRSLNTALLKIKSQRTPASSDRMTILADETTPYVTLRSVMASAQNSGFAEFKLVVVEDQ